MGELFSKLGHEGKENIISFQELTNYDWPPIFVNKVILEHSHTHSFKYCLWLPLYHSGSTEWFPQRLCELQTGNIYYLAPYSSVC